MTRRDTEGRGLVVLADGVHAAFAAGAVAELARRGTAWSWGLGAGLGAHVAVLALLGEAEEARRRWQRQGEAGLPLLRSLASAALERLGPVPGVRAAADAWSMEGWLDPAPLLDHLAPEAAGLPSRLRAAGARCRVCVEELDTGGWRAVELTEADAAEAGELLLAAACFPGGWGPRSGPPPAGSRWGGAAAAVLPEPDGGDGVDLVCGFPFPSAGRRAAGRALLETVQVREEALAARSVQAWLDVRRGAGPRVIAPTTEVFARVAGRDGADLAVEYPLAWERNGELLALVLDLGGAAARAAPEGAAGS